MTSDSMSEEDEKCDGATEFDLDKVLDEIKMGKYQIYIFLLISLPIFIAGVQSSFIFTAGQLNYRSRKKFDMMILQFRTISINFYFIKMLDVLCLNVKEMKVQNSMKNG